MLTRKQKEHVLEHFALTAQPIISRAFGLGCCIQASRVTLTVLEAFGISAQAVPVKLMVGLPHRDLAMHYGYSPEELTLAGVSLHPQRFDERGWMGHLVVIPDDPMQDQRWIVDPSFEQAIQGLKAAGAEIGWEPMIQLVPLGAKLERMMPQRHSFTLPCGTPIVTIYTITRDTSYRKERSWGDPANSLVAATIIQDVGESLDI